MRRGGFAMLGVLMLMALLAIISIAVLSMSAGERRRSVRNTRTEVRESCAFSGLNYARTYFGNRFNNWDSFLANPAHYNPMDLPLVTTPAWGGPKANLTTGLAALKTARPELFLDLDSDGASDVYIFIRDNNDEFSPAAPNFQQDNDQNVIVGAVCISSTMQPRREDNSIDADRLVMEALMGNNPAQSASYVQSDTNGNTNNTASN